VYDQDAEVLIKLRHPGYPDNKNVLLVFPALNPITADNDDNNDDNDNNCKNDGTNAKATFGIYYKTARLAYAITANNRFYTYLGTGCNRKLSENYFIPKYLLILECTLNPKFKDFHRSGKVLKVFNMGAG
jgi:hypothetical protein